MYESAKLYIAVHPDQHYADANHLEKIDLSSTGEEIVEIKCFLGQDSP